MDIKELSLKLGVTVRTIENRLRGLTETEKESIRSEIRKGSVRSYVYNSKALDVLHRTPTRVHKVNKSLPDNDFTELEHIKKMYDNLLKANEELKKEISYYKNKLDDIQKYQQDIEKTYAESSKYFQTLLSQQQQLHLSLQKKMELIEAPITPKRKSWFK